ncbi:MAG: hypothetical protein LC099_00110 [Anaerolineales bacterium]|nr:hypothetical protein [Anaerolineales bacterium]
MKINLGRALVRSWQIIWNYKILWVFGVFAGFVGARWNAGTGGRGGGGRGVNPFNEHGGMYGGERFIEQINEYFQRYMIIIISVCLALVILSFLLYALGMIGRIGIIKGVYKIEDGASALTFGELWSESQPYFWRFFGLYFLPGLAFLIILLPLIVIAILTGGIGLVLLLPLLCLLVPVAWAVNIILEQAQAAIVAEDLTMFDGLKRGWEIVKSDILGMIVFSIVLGIGGGIVGFIFALPLMLAVIPFFMGAMTTAPATSEAIMPYIWVSVACFGIYLPVLFVLNGALTAYIQTAWTLVYRQLARPAAPSSPHAPIFAQPDA